MAEKANHDGGTGHPPSPSRQEWERLFELHFRRKWDATVRAQVLDAVSKRRKAFLVLREIERVVVGVAALRRMLDGVPPPEEEPPPVFPSDRRRDERYLLVWVFEEGLVPFAPGPVSPRALAIVSLLMGYEHDAHRDDVLHKAEARMKTSRRRYRQDRAPNTPETMERIAQASSLRTLEQPVRQALDALVQMFEGTVRNSESVPAGTMSQS